MLGCGMNRRERADQLEGVSLGAAGDQGVQAVLGYKRVDHPGAPASESGIPHSRASGLWAVYQA